MKITINENSDFRETEVIINCNKTDEQILRICAGLRMSSNKVTGINNGQTFILEAANILYAETVDRKTFIYTEDQVYETPLKLYELEERLSSVEFVRARKSCIFNFGAVKSIRAEFGGRMLCVLKNGENITVSRQYSVAIKQKLGMMKGESI